jgi:phosphoglucosamine mutase
MQKRYFGTDGIRGKVDGEELAPERLVCLGIALGHWLNENQKHGPILFVRDTRQSGLSICREIAKGLQSFGFPLYDGGIAPTPAAPLAARKLGAVLSVVVTASHNPATDNGVKLFDCDGYKFDDDRELSIEQKMDAHIVEVEELRFSKDPVFENFDAARYFVENRRKLLPDNALEGFRIVLDCANGATSETSPSVLRSLGAEVMAIGCAPNGLNINENCGSECPERLCSEVLRWKAHIGIAHDGDGDRLLICDENGKQADGDRLIFAIAKYLFDGGLLKGGAIAVTVMSNGGLDLALVSCGLRAERTSVGDRYIFSKMLDQGLNFGGESSGHLIFLDEATCGDGLLSALLILKALKSSGAPVSSIHDCVKLHAIAKKNLPIKLKIPFEEIPGFPSAIVDFKKNLPEGSRILLRYSGTENKIRLMAESAEDATAVGILDDLIALARKYLRFET